jgi:hypothetical protein
MLKEQGKYSQRQETKEYDTLKYEGLLCVCVLVGGGGQRREMKEKEILLVVNL